MIHLHRQADCKQRALQVQKIHSFYIFPLIFYSIPVFRDYPPEISGFPTEKGMCVSAHPLSGGFSFVCFLFNSLPHSSPLNNCPLNNLQNSLPHSRYPHNRFRQKTRPAALIIRRSILRISNSRHSCSVPDCCVNRSELIRKDVYLYLLYGYCRFVQAVLLQISICRQKSFIALAFRLFLGKLLGTASAVSRIPGPRPGLLSVPLPGWQEIHCTVRSAGSPPGKYSAVWQEPPEARKHPPRPQSPT